MKKIILFQTFVHRVALLAGSMLLSGCVFSHGDFTVLSNKLVRETEFAVSGTDKTTDIAGKDVQHIVVFVPIGGTPVLENAIDDALFKGGGDVVTNATVKTWSWYIPYIYGQTVWSVTGDVVKTRHN